MSKTLFKGISKFNPTRGALYLLTAIALLMTALSSVARTQDQDDPPGRVARLGYIEGSVSFQPAGEDEWVEAVPNRPMTTGDKIWADRDSRAEVQLGSATIDLAPNTGFSFLNLDDRTIQIQLSTGRLNVRLWNLDRDNVFEVDTPNQAFTVGAPGRYGVEASENGDYTVVTVREGEGESTGNGQSYTMHAGQRFTLSGTNSLNAEVDQIGGPDDFDNWSGRREARYQDSPSARYCDRRVVGYQDLDEYGDWRSTPEYGYAWFPRVDPGWAPYHQGHWAWVDPWGWTWVDDAPWGYAPFHYGRWANVYGRWGWIPGPREVRPVYAPALVAFVGGGAVVAGGAVAWFPLGPREVYVPSYHVSEGYVNRVNVTNTTVNTTVVRNVYNTTIVNNNTTINNVTYVNRNVQGAVTAVPQHAFASSQPVARAAVAVNTRQLGSGPVSARAAVAPARESVLGAHANTAGRVAAPPQAVMTRQVIAKSAPPPPPPSFASREKALQQHPGQPLPRQELQKLRPANAPPTQMVKVAPPARPATPTPTANRPGNQPGAPAANTRPGGTQPAPANQPGANNRPGQPSAAGPPPRNERPQPGYRPEPNAAQPNNRPEQPAAPPARNDHPPSAQPNRPEANPAMPNARPEPNTPEPNRAEPNRPQPNNRPGQPAPPPARNDQPPAAQPDNRPETNRPQPTPRSEPPERSGNPPAPANNRYSEQPSARPPQPAPNEPARTQAPPPAQRSDRPPAAESRPAPQQRPPAKPAQDNKKQDQKDQKKQDQKDQKK